MRIRLRPAYSSAELAQIYRVPHRHDRWPDHRVRVVETIKLARELGVPDTVADLSCGDAAIAGALLLDAGQDGIILGDFAPGYELTGPIEQTIHQIPHVGMFICSETVEHLDDPDAVLKLIRDKADSLVLSTPLGEITPHNPEHYWGWDEAGVREMLEASGWEPVLQRNVIYKGEFNWVSAAYQLWGCRLAVSGSMGNVLITGAAGFVGRHFTKHLQQQGWYVRAIDIRPGEYTTLVRDACDWFRGGPDSAAHFDLVLHCAAVVGGRQVIDNDPLAQAVNLELDAAMFRWALRTRPGRVIYFSSSAAYPVNLQKAGMNRELREDDIGFTDMGVPDQVYGWAKLTGEYLARKAREKGLAVSVVRPFSGYGEDQSADYPFPAFIDRAIRREDPFLVWGDGSQVRDFIHIEDIVAAVMAMYERDRNGPVNLATGIPTSMRLLAQLVCEQAGYKPEIETVPSAPSGVAYRVGSPTNLSQFFYPKVKLETGIRRSLEYRSRNLDLARG